MPKIVKLFFCLLKISSDKITKILTIFNFYFWKFFTFFIYLLIIHVNSKSHFQIILKTKICDIFMLNETKLDETIPSSAFVDNYYDFYRKRGRYFH